MVDIKICFPEILYITKKNKQKKTHPHTNIDEDNKNVILNSID